MSGIIINMKENIALTDNDEWEVQDEVFEPLDSEFKFVLDVCATKENSKCGRFLTKETNALTVDWFEYLKNIGELDGFVWCNPPLSTINEWSKKIRLEADKGVNIVTLTAARTNTV